MSPSWHLKMPFFRGRFLQQCVLTKSSPKPNVKTGRQEGRKPEKGTEQGKNFFCCPDCQTTENLVPSGTSHQPLLSGLSLLVSLSASHSKTLFICFIHASFYHLSTELLGTLFTAKSSPFFLSFFPFFFFFGVIFCLFGFFCHFFFAMLLA